VFVFKLADGTGFKVCASGNSDSTLLLSASWTWEIVGSRSNGTVINQPQPPGSGTSYTPPCAFVYKNSTGFANVIAGGFTSTLTYTPIGGMDAPVSVAGTGTWDPVEGDQVSGMSI
jgi:hypothetical protein